MRFERIELPAFGPFTDFRLDLSARPEALQLVYGPNEAGKSSLLRALTALLYGVPTRSPDAHVHDFTRLRIAGALRTKSGELLEVVRRKGNKNTLLDRAEKPLPDNLLAPLLGGLDEALFSQMFGLDHVRLREGAEALLRGGGHVGEGLFDAGSGARAIRQAVDALRAEADELYKPRGRTPKLNVSVELLREQRRKLRDAMLSPQVYADQQKAVADVLAAREAAALRRRALIAEQSKLAHKLALCPLLARHAALADELTRASAERGQQSELEPFARPEVTQALRALEQRLATSQAFRMEEPALRAELAALEREAESLSGRLGAVAACARELDLPARTRLRRFAEREQKLALRKDELTRQLLAERERLARVAARSRDLAPLSAREGLGELVERCRESDLLGALARNASELARETSPLERGVAQLGLTLTAGELLRLVLPDDAIVEELEARHTAHVREAERLLEHKQKLESEQQKLARRRSELLADGALATDADLAATHEARARAFASVVAAWRDGAPFMPALVQDYERAEATSDELAARMRIEARRYNELVRCDAERTLLERAREELACAQGELTAKRAALAEELAELARPLWLAAPRSPHELCGKLSRLRELCTRAERIAALTCDRAQLAAQAQAQVSALARALARDVDEGPLEAALALLLSATQAALAAQRERQGEQRQVSQQRDELSAGVAIASASLEALHEEERGFRSDFGQELAHHGLAPGLTADEVLACLDDLTELGQKQRQIAAVRERFRQMEGFDAELSAELARVAAGCGLELARQAPAQALATLGASERAYREQQRDLERSASELSELARQLHERGQGATLAELRALVHGFDPELGRARQGELDSELEQASESLRELDQRLGALQAGLARLEEPSSAVELAEQTECELASSRALARRYIEVKLALALLTREIERYRSEHQGPVLARASALFPRLTLGRYRGLEVDYDERDEPVLACVQQNGKRVHVHGLSDGTRDQLYLALRVASIERLLAANVALPLILDDAFVHFDDARAEAALSVLGELAQRTQVLFFTHHARMVELARRALGRDGVVVHQLERERSELYRDHGPLFS